MTAKARWGILATGWIADLFVKDLQLTGHIVTAVGSQIASASADGLGEAIEPSPMCTQATEFTDGPTPTSMLSISRRLIRCMPPTPRWR